MQKWENLFSILSQRSLLKTALDGKIAEDFHHEKLQHIFFLFGKQLSSYCTSSDKALKNLQKYKNTILITL